MTDSTESTDSTADLEEFRSRMAGAGNALSLIAKLNDGIVAESGLDLRTFHLVRAAAMAASGAPTFSWQVMLELMDDEVSGAEMMGVLTAIAPIIGTARYATAVDNILDGDPLG